MRVQDTHHTLRPYQITAVRDVRAHWGSGRLRVCVVLPTGAGKTTVAAALAAGARRPLAVVHTLTLRDQMRARLGCRVTTYQALAGLARRGQPLLGPSPDLVILDECHHGASPRWAAGLALLPDVPTVGLTATPERADGVGLAGLFGALVAPVTYSQLIRAGHLVDCDVEDCQDFDGPADAYLGFGGGRPAIVFVPTIEAGQDCLAQLTAAGVRAAAIDCTVPARKRRALVAAYTAGGLDALVSPMALSEGFDAPRAEVCVLDRTCGHVGLYLQTAGRVLRPYPLKRRALLLDCRGASERHGSPTDDRAYSLDGEPIARVAPTPRARPRPESRRPPMRSGVVLRGDEPAAHRAAVGVARAVSHMWGRVRQWLAA